MQIILCGPPAVGKSTIGQLLAKQLEISFYDTDQLVGENFRTLYREQGEKAFRIHEKEVIASLEEKEGVIALGGGCMEPPSGHVIYLKASWEVLLERLCSRPELPTYLPEKDSREAFFVRIEPRLEHYKRMADTTIDTDVKSPVEIVELIKKEVLSFLS